MSENGQSMSELIKDLQYGTRLLLKSPGFTVVTILALAVGVGANITIFGFANTLLIRPLDASQPDRLIRAYSSGTDLVSVIDYNDYLQYRDRNLSLSNVAIFHWGGLRPVRAGGPAEMIHVMPVSGNYFETLGVPAAMGRTINPDDDSPEATRVVMLSDICWRHHFAAAPDVIGRTIFIGRVPFIIIGVTPAWFRGTIGGPVIPQFYVPWSRHAGGGQLLGRLNPGLSRSEVQADLSRVAAQLAAEQKRHISISVYPATELAPSIIKTMSLFALLLMAVVSLVLLIACDNIAILLLAHSAARRREIAVRLALGASRGRVVRQLLAESLLLSVLGGAGASALAFIIVRWITQIRLPVPMPLGLSFSLDWHVVSFAIAISLCTTLLFGLGPALQTVRTDVLSSLKEGGTTTGGSRMRSGLVVAQVAMSTALLVTSGALVHSVAQPEASERGFTADHILMATVNLGSAGYSKEQGLAFYERLFERLQGSTGIAAVNIVDNIPLANNAPLTSVDLGTDAQSSAGSSLRRVFVNLVSRGHFQTLRIPLIAGRDFTAHDDNASPAVGIVNETLARSFWRGEVPIGKWLRPEDGSRIEVVGLVRDSKYESLKEAPKAFLYRPITQQYVPTATLFVKTDGDPLAATSTVRAAVADLDPNLVVYNLNTLEDRLGMDLLPNRAAAIVSGVLGLLSLALGAIGTYGIMAFLAGQRRREISIRMALGASPLNIVSLITKQGMAWVGGGLLLGLVAAFALISFARRLLYGVLPADPIAFIGITLLLATTAYLACFVPARRASRANPVIALHEE